MITSEKMPLAQVNPNGMFTSGFWAQVNKTSGAFMVSDRTECWAWTGGGDGKGYGRAFAYRKRNGKARYYRAHTLAYIFEVGSLPLGLELDHLCRNKICVRPNHLEAVAPIINVLRSLAPTARFARQTHCKRGHPLSEENLRLKYTALGSGVSRVCLQCKHQANETRSIERGRHRAKDRLQWTTPSSSSKVTYADADLIRTIYAAGNISQKAIGLRFGIKQVVVSNIVLGKTYQRRNPK